MKTSDFDFPLPAHLIADSPLPERDGSRLLVVDKHGRGLTDRVFRDLPSYLEAGDMLLLNNTRVLPYRLVGKKKDGRELEILLVRNISGSTWEILSRGGHTGEVEVSGKLRAVLSGGKTAELICEGEVEKALDEYGLMPLPPYIKRRPNQSDRERYQTVYAEADGSIAAPTAGLHFTGRMLDEVAKKGVLVRYLTLHVGRGTFAPVRAESVADHPMEAERFTIDTELLEEIRGLGGRLITVGTTTTRAIEGLLSDRFTPSGGSNGSISGKTDIFIYPGYRFRAVSGMVTNFHLPRSTPLMLASALSGPEIMRKAYDHAIGSGYRFFSYGDAMLIG